MLVMNASPRINHIHAFVVSERKLADNYSVYVAIAIGAVKEEIGSGRMT